ncbi:hypothetical protein KQI67_27195 [Bacillus albus]|uniref:hypothetical protein n=1 Tax=Bacillus albus TaxID=2026189 RepID=UPI000ADA1750|nr:hypothetical protein [Bacillus albus]MBU5220273.1 hypothetical protein [Bacillus albus]
MIDEFEALFTKVNQVQGDQELTCSCTDFKMTPNSTECKGYWDYTEACGHPKR